MKDQKSFYRNKYARITVGVIAGLILFASTIYIGTELGIQEHELSTLFVGSLIASGIFGIVVGTTYFSFIGIIFFVAVIWAGIFTKFHPGYTLALGVIACLVTSFIVTLASRV